MNIDVYAMFWNEERLLPYFLRHYGSFARKIVLFDNESTDRSRAIAEAHPQVVVKSLKTDGEFREDALQAVKRRAWREDPDKPDWVIACDIDEFLVHPRLIDYLAECRSRGVSVPVPTGWQMIAESFPDTDGQIYEQITRGYPDRYISKNCIFDPSLIEDIGYGHGCHNYVPTGRVVEHFSGELRLLHCKYIDPDFVAERQEQQLQRLSDYNKRLGLSIHLLPAPASRAQYFEFQRWARPLPSAPDRHKLHVGCGGNRLPGWENHDIELDISQPLPFPDGSLHFVFAEHVFEHISAHACVRFLKECFRCLAPGGVLRLCVPCIENIISRADPKYLEFVTRFGVSATLPGAIDAIVYNHGHQSIWTQELLKLLPAVYGFKTTSCELRKSSHAELNDIDAHWRAIGSHHNWVETSVVECQKPA